MIELILNIIFVLLVLGVIWFTILLTVGTDISGRSSGIGTTTMFFLLFIMIIVGLIGIILVVNQLFFT